MFILTACGIHRRPTTEEMTRILGGEMAGLFAGRIFHHDPDDDTNLVTVGRTPTGCAVRLNRLAVEADRLVLIGAASYHYHAGYGGGRKSLVPGLAARDTIAYNHSLTLDPREDRIHPRVGLGILDGNPVSEEMLAGASLRRPDFIVNTVVTADGRLAGVFAGDMDLAHRAACRRVEEVWRVDIPRPADFVVAFAESAPNWVQAHKALYNASRAVHEEGRIVLVAPCPEGLGDERFRHWVRQGSEAAIYLGLRQSPEVLGQTALSTRMRGARTVLVTGMPSADARDLGIRPAPDLQTAVRETLEYFAGRPAPPTCYLMPEAMHAVPSPPRGAVVSAERLCLIRVARRLREAFSEVVC
jgi:nickel-dependent lactate racemase